MAGNEFEPYDDPSLKGLSRYFNNRTIKGRANVSMATFALLTGYFIYRKLFGGRGGGDNEPEIVEGVKATASEMAGASDAAEEAKLQGISKIFNAQTTRGRANVAMATYAGVGLLIAFFALKPKKAKK